MTDLSVFGKRGLKDWKRASQLVPFHERSSMHRDMASQTGQKCIENGHTIVRCVFYTPERTYDNRERTYDSRERKKDSRELTSDSR